MASGADRGAVHKGRGATFNPKVRFESAEVDPFDDGWGSLALARADDPPPRTEVTPDAGGDGPGWLEREVDRLAALVAPAVAADPVAPFTFAEFEGNVGWLRDFLRTRTLFVDCAARAALDSTAPQSCPRPAPLAFGR